MLKKYFFKIFVFVLILVPSIVLADVFYLEIGNEDAGIVENIGSGLFGDDFPSDGHLTMAGRLEYGFSNTPEFIDNLADKVPFFINQDRQATYFLAQGAYTPEGSNKSINTVVADDRPYAGYLKFGCRIQSKKNSSNKIVDTLDLTAGLIGSASLASRVQEAAHSAGGIDSVAGWDNQLNNEPIINIDYERQFRFIHDLAGSVMTEFAPHIGAGLGNMFTYISSGFMLRIGSDLDKDYGGPRQNLQLSGLSFYQPAVSSLFSWNIFTGLEANAIMRNIFLDGNTFSSSHSVDKENFVIDTVVGAAITYKNCRIILTLVDRSEEFDLQQDHDSLVKFSISFGI